MKETPQAFPLQWPVGKPRTSPNRRTRAKFGKSGRGFFQEGETTRYESRRGLSVAESIQRVQGELDRLSARYVVISSNLELRRDGLPRSDRREPLDPGVAVYFELKGKPIVLAGDAYDRVADNIAAIAAHIDAMRAMERHGVGSLEQMFAGFAALPGAVAPDDWREPLGYPSNLAQAEANYRERMKYAHPDVNNSAGAEAVAAKLNAAIEAARKHFST